MASKFKVGDLVYIPMHRKISEVCKELGFNYNSGYFVEAINEHGIKINGAKGFWSVNDFEVVSNDVSCEYEYPILTGNMYYENYVTKKCECGAEKIGYTSHSSWCPKHD